MPASAASVNVSRSNNEVVITPTGDLDMLLAQSLEAQAAHALDDAPTVLTIDMGQVPFCDSAGINALVRIRQVCARRDVNLRLVDLAPRVRSVLQITGVLGFLNMPMAEEDD